MTLGDPYATLTDLKARIGDRAGPDTALTNALATASLGIEAFCNRQFNDAGTASPRVYYPDGYRRAEVDDFHTTTGLVIATDEGGTGSYDTTWAAGDYQLEPLNGIVNGQTGWPYNTIRGTGARLFPLWNYGYGYLRPAPLQVTARWGWATVPAPVVEACLIIAEETWRLKDAPFGIAGSSEYGVMRVRANPMATEKLTPYRRDAVLVA